MDFRYARPPPPPPPSSDLHQPPPQQPVPPPPGPWYSGQFQYHSPSPPPPHWAPQSQHSDHHLPPPPPYAAAPPPPPPMQYSSNPYPLPPRPHMPPPPLQPHYPPVNQEWSNANWGHQGWEYSAPNQNEDDWAARARAWAASKVVTDDQHQHSQLVPASRSEEINYQDQYSQNLETPYTEFQQHSLPPSSYHQYPSSFAPPPRTPANPLPEPSSFGSGYAPDGHFSYTARDGNLRDSTAAYPHQEPAPTSLLVHQQEVPSSYSSVAGKEEVRDMNGKFYQPSHMPFASAPQYQVQQSLSPSDRSISVEQPHYAFSNPSAEPTTDLSNQPLDFGPRFGHEHDPFGQSKYGNESGGSIGAISTGTAMPSINAWTSSAAPGMPYPSMPPVHPTGQQVDPSVGVPSPVSMHSAPLFGRITGSSFQPTMPSASSTFPIGTSNAFHATNAFPGDTYGTPAFPERPKKASVPNWLREEIIKKKAVIGSAAPELSRQDPESNEDEVMDRPLGKGDQADGKSVESSRLTEEEDDDKDYVEAARTAAINQEIKRILTEVLLKVTDELFDEIATEVLDEDDLNAEVERKAIASSDIISQSSAAVPTPKSSAKVLIPGKTKGTDLDDVSGKSSSSSPGDVLGLGSYASDDDEDKEVQNLPIPSSKSSKPLVHLAENGSSQVDGNVRGKKFLDEESDSHGMSPNGDVVNHGSVGSELTRNRVGAEPSQTDSLTEEYHNDNSSGDKVPDRSSISKSKQSVGDKGVGKHELLIEGLAAKNPLPDDSQGRSPRNGSEKSGSKRKSASKDYNEEVESGKDKIHTKVDDDSRIQDERHVKRVKKDDQNGSKQKIKERDSGKRVNKAESKDDKKEIDRDRRSQAKEDGRKQERSKDEKNERSKHKSVGDSSRHKRHHSPSPGGKARSSKDNSSLSHAHASSDSSSDDSRRKVYSKRRDLSPSPVRSRRQVSRSPPSKRSQHRHSLYSSLETTRERRRSRSRSRRG
ncbi:arginine/serine-rich protein PNISR isoform X2 [Cynara cardunculus var. scolymus]|uniref:arginine/serine-rich protein PNISR isoform X2 n=1 Tax=Cynara cardunculus var. scolymus TaxID=59895 RepID=UPI000D6284AF|nr:arginine/serine-rich protein PNISR isoform X2 [Cynara cardunculus var. scolymus]